MRAEEARKQALKGLADARKNTANQAMRDRMDRAADMISSPDFCRVPIKAYGADFRAWQAQADASVAAMLSRVKDAVASAAGPGDFDNILQRLQDYLDAKASFEAIKAYIENNEGGDTIMTSELKDNLLKLISQTVDDIAAFDKLSCDYAGTEAGGVKDTMDRLLQAKDIIADTELPNTNATLEMYSQIRGELDKIRESIAKDYGYDIDTNLARLMEKTEKLVDMAKSGKLKGKAIGAKADLGPMYPSTATIDVSGANADQLDELDAGVVIYKTFNQADSIVNKMYDNAVNIMFGIKGLTNDPQLKRLQERGEKLYKQLTEARTDAQKSLITGQLRNVTKQIKDREAYVSQSVSKLSDYYAVTGMSYNEIATYVDTLRSYFIPLPGQYRLTLKKYQDYLKKIEYNINSVRPRKLFSRRKNDVRINSVADIVELYQKALADHDNDTIDIIKTAIDINVTQIQSTLPRLDVPGRETETEREKTPEELEKERKEMEEFAKMFGEPQTEKDPLKEFEGRFGGGKENEPEQKEAAQQDSGESERPVSDEEIENILREVKMMRNDGEA